MFTSKTRAFKIFLSFILFANISVASENANLRYFDFSKKNYPSSIKIEFDTAQSAKFYKNMFKAYTYLSKGSGRFVDFQSIDKQFSKKWYKAFIIVDGKKYKAKVRIFGELKDHIRIPVSSLKIKLLEGNISNQVSFNLFLMHTRNGEREIYWSSMMNDLGIKSFYTKKINVNFMGNQYHALMTENSSKEFLEQRGIRETPILKQDDFYKFHLKNKKHSNFFENYFSMVVNNASFLKNDTALLVASHAIGEFIRGDNDLIVKNNKLFFTINKQFGYHGLLHHNRKFIYFPLSSSFESIYYDGSINYKNFKKNLYRCDSKSKFFFSTSLSNFKKKYKNLSNKKLSQIESCLYIHNTQLVNNFRANNFIGEKTNQPEKKYLRKLQIKIRNVLENNKKNKSNSKTLVKFSFYYQGLFYLCDYDYKNNKIFNLEKIKSKIYKQAIRGKLFFNYFDEEIPVLNLGNLSKKNKIKNINLKNFQNLDKNMKTVRLKENSTYLLKLKDEIFYNHRIIFNSVNTKIVINGKLKKKDKLFFNDSNAIDSKKLSSARFDEHLLTGCVSFVDVIFLGGELKSSRMKCEDSINIINSHGKIDEISISDSKFDALDIDHSNISIQKVSIQRAGNDCLDFSFGNYSIKSSEVSFCADKGLSAGEQSHVTINNFIGSNLFYGIVSKDSSDVAIENTLLSNVNYCLSAYNKKQEFDGAKLILNKLNCKEFLNFKKVEKNSKILITNEKIQNWQ